jgi:hypothetical protein
MTKIEEVGIDPGFGCNFNCAHCLLDNRLRKSRRGVSKRETAQICAYSDQIGHCSISIRPLF